MKKKLISKSMTQKPKNATTKHLIEYIRNLKAFSVIIFANYGSICDLCLLLFTLFTQQVSKRSKRSKRSQQLNVRQQEVMVLKHLRISHLALKYQNVTENTSFIYLDVCSWNDIFQGQCAEKRNETKQFNKTFLKLDVKWISRLLSQLPKEKHN